MGYKYSQYTLSRQPPAGGYLLESPLYSAYNNIDNDDYEEPTSTMPAGTLLHKGFYDLLAMIPTPSPSRLLWGPPTASADPVVAGPRYEDIPRRLPHAPPPQPLSPPTSPVSSPKRGRRISKDMVSKPTGFVCVSALHPIPALSLTFSRTDTWFMLQMPIRLRPCSPDGDRMVLGSSVVCKLPVLSVWRLWKPLRIIDPSWANPIIAKIRQRNQFRNANDNPNAPNPSQLSRIDAGALGPLRVVNGVSSTTSSNLTTAARENVSLLSGVDGLPGRPGNSTIRWGGGLMTPHPEVLEGSEDLQEEVLPQAPPVHRTINPSLATLEKAVAARIYFENLYFPLLRQTPSREQRRLAMERDMVDMQIPEPQREQLRSRWRQNETAYLREQRRKVDVTGFVKMKTIGHGGYLSVYLPVSHFVPLVLDRRFRCCISRQREEHWKTVCNEGGVQFVAITVKPPLIYTPASFEKPTCCAKVKKATSELNEIS